MEQEHGSDASPGEPGGLQFQCRICLRSFKRSGHLRRHERTHTAARPFPCTRCSRTFTRRDALQRHSNSHIDAPNLLQQGCRACLLCASAKTRCSGDLPCKRCSNRGAECVYPLRDTQPTESELTGATSVHPSSSILPQNGVVFQSLPHQSPDDFMPDANGHPYNDWADGFFHETNWLEAPIGDVDLSPLSWTFGPYIQPVVNVDNVSPSQFMSAPSGLAVIHEQGIPNDDAAMNADHDSSPRDHPSGEYYVDGEPARLPRVRRRIEASTRGQTAWSGTFSLHLPDTAVLPNAENDVELADDNYRAILELYSRLCCDGPLGAAFTHHELPPKPILELFAGYFFDRLSILLPFLHWSTLASANRSYILDLAIIALGSQFIGNANFSVSLHEFTRRCLVDIPQELETSSETQFSTAAALLLNIVGSAYCGDKKLRQHALQARSWMKIHFERMRRQIQNSSVDSPVDSLTHKWQVWVQHESNTRLAFSMWLVDTMLAAHCEASPILHLGSVTFLLPSADDMWHCKDVEGWDSLYKVQQRRTTLVELLQKLYYNKSFPSVQSEFIRILAIHGLFHRLWEVERYYSGTLSHWEPSSTGVAGESPFPKVAPWLPAVPAFKKWQNVSCDALDILHWQANSTIGQMKGLEHPTVLHLHFARIVLLCPCSDILALAHHLASTSPVAASPDEINKATNAVRRWVVHHQFKARLAAIHAGVTFWHIRRHGIDAFYEPSALGLAALVLWAFSLFADGHSSRSRAQSVPQDSVHLATTSSGVAETIAGNTIVNGIDFRSSDDADIILLDRPTDDELVQQFIRDGGSMRPFMSSVGDVFAPHAPPRILDKCLALLRDQGCWGTAAEWIKLLQSLRASRRLDSRSH